MRKAAALAVIGVVFSASVLLRPHGPVREMAVATSLTAPPNRPPNPINPVRDPLRPPARGRTGVRPRSERGPTPLGAGSEAGRSGVGAGPDRARSGVAAGSEYEYAATQLSGTSALLEMRTVAVPTQLPGITRASLQPASRGSVSGAMVAASRQTAGAFRTAARAVRSVF